MGDAFKALADPTRRTILKLLDEKDLTAGEIAAHFNMAQPSVTHHLNILKNADLISSERNGQRIIYSLNTTIFQEVLSWFYDFSFSKDENLEENYEG